MKTLEYGVRVAMMRILLDIVLADNKEDERELEFYFRIAEELGLNELARVDVKKQNSLLALVQIDSLSQEAKEYFAKLMGQMIIVDEDINYNEVRMYEVVTRFCDIKLDFCMDDYPEYTRS